MEMNMNEQMLDQSLLVPDFVHPCEVLLNKSLSADKKRAILSLWASDACAVESRPGFRWMPGTPGPILFDHILRALQALDNETDGITHSVPIRGMKITPRRDLA